MRPVATRTEVGAVEIEAVEVGAKDERVLVFHSDEREAALTAQVMAQAGLHTLKCRDEDALSEALREGAGAALLFAEALTSEVLEMLNVTLNVQPHWSNLPLLLCLPRAETNAAHLTEPVGALLRSSRSVVVLETPPHPVVLLSAVHSALKARRRQYQVRDLSAKLETCSDDLDQCTQNQTDELQNWQMRFSKVFYASPVPVTITTLSEGRYIDINESALKLLGFERSEVIGRTASELSHWESEAYRTRDELLNHLQEEGSLKDAAIRYRTKTGRVRDALATFEVIELAGELCLLSMVLDVSERKRDEAELMQAVQEVMSDTAWFSRSFVEKLAQVRTGGANAEHQAEIKDLTPREREVLERVAGGYDNGQIAAALHLSENTVRNYLANVFTKLNVHTRAEAVVWARTRGLGSGV